MPLYEYQCTACGHQLEIIEKVTEESTRECPECAAVMERLLSAPAIQFKGSGWYVTDYARKDGSPTKESKSTWGSKKSKESKESSSSSSDSSSSSSKKGD